MCLKDSPTGNLLFTIAGLNAFTDFKIIPFSVDGKQVTSMGGVTVQSEASLENIFTRNIDLLLLPGGNAWDEHKNL